MPGYELSALDEKREDIFPRYACWICRLLVRHAVQTSCGHYYCESCVSARCREGDDEVFFSCGAVDGRDGRCGRLLRRVDCFDDLGVRRSVNALAVSCRRAEVGCPWKGTVAALEPHVKEDCLYELAGCPSSGCPVRIAKIDLQQHLQLECLHRQKTCDSCNRVVTAREAERHLREECPGVPVDCPDCNATGLVRRDLPEHRDALFGDCDGVRGPCPFSTVGCTATSLMARAGVRRHLDDDARRHLVLLLRQSMRSLQAGEKWEASTAERCRELLDRVRAVEERCDRLAGSESTRRDDGSDLAGRCRRLDELVQNHEVLFQELVKRLDRVEKSLPASPSLSIAASDESGSIDGTLVWRIDEFRRKRQEARQTSDPEKCLYSPSFRVERFGYKVRLCAYLDGDGTRRRTHLALFFQLMRGDYDALLQWPFRHAVTFVLVDQRGRSGNIVTAFTPDTLSSSFQRPRRAVNYASGLNDVVRLSRLDEDDSDFVRDDVLFVKAMVDPSSTIG